MLRNGNVKGLEIPKKMLYFHGPGILERGRGGEGGRRGGGGGLGSLGRGGGGGVGSLSSEV